MHLEAECKRKSSVQLTHDSGKGSEVQLRGMCLLYALCQIVTMQFAFCILRSMGQCQAVQNFSKDKLPYWTSCPALSCWTICPAGQAALPYPAGRSALPCPAGQSALLVISLA